MLNSTIAKFEMNLAKRYTLANAAQLACFWECYLLQYDTIIHESRRKW